MLFFCIDKSFMAVFGALVSERCPESGFAWGCAEKTLDEAAHWDTVMTHSASERLGNFYHLLPESSHTSVNAVFHLIALAKQSLQSSTLVLTFLYWSVDSTFSYH